MRQGCTYSTPMEFKMNKYVGLLVAPDGDFITDYKSESVEEVERKLADRGSCWFFYPFEAVIKISKTPIRERRIISICEPFEEFRGKKVQSFLDFIENTYKEEV